MYSGDYGVSAGVSAAASIYLAKQQRDFQKKMFKRQLDWQKKFAKKGIRWRVADAKAAGLHPLAALGAQVSSYSPQYVGGTDQLDAQTARAMGQAAGELFQGVRGTSEMERITLESAHLDLDYKEMRNMKEWQNMTGSPTTSETIRAVESLADRTYNMPGQSVDAPGVDLRNPQVTRSKAPGLTRGVQPTEQWSVMGNVKTGQRLFPSLTTELTEQMEDNLHFKMTYYSSKLSDYYSGFKAAFGGPKSEASKRWMSFWRPRLPGNRKGFYWAYSTAGGYFYEKKVSEYRRRSPSFRWDSKQRGKRPDWSGLTY